VKVSLNMESFHDIEDGLKLRNLALNHEIDKVPGEFAEMDVNQLFVVDRIRDIGSPRPFE